MQWHACKAGLQQRVRDTRSSALNSRALAGRGEQGHMVTDWLRVTESEECAAVT